MLTIVLIGSALLNFILVAVRVVESFYELRKNPDLDTWQEVKQVFINFFKVETYDSGSKK
jgi:F0F1-type ATP synthase gamma subunit